VQTVVVNGTAITPTASGNLSPYLLSVFTNSNGSDINNPTNYQVANTSALVSALNANIATSLSLIPLSSPTSGVILKKDPLTGADLPASSTLGPIFTQRAETIGKGNWYIGLTYQDYHFTSLDGTNLNGFPVLYTGGDPSGIINPNTSKKAATAPLTFNLAMDVRLSQELAFITYGLFNRFDLSVGLPTVHASVAARSYNGVVYSGTGLDFNSGDQCWCINTLTPGSYSLARPVIGSAASSKTGFGDLALRFKGQVIERMHMSLAVGTDLRLPTGDEKNYLGTGTTSVKPFFAMSLYTKQFGNGIVLAPHVDAGWQFSGKSILGGTFQSTTQPAQLDNGVTVPVPVAPLVFTKNYLPDVFAWSAGTEVAFGRHNTLVLDVIGNEIGMIHGIQTLGTAPVPSGFNPPIYDPNYSQVHALQSGFIGTGRGSYGQYSGAFGYKLKLLGNLVATFQMLVRFDNNGLTARTVPLFGLGYSL
jgi:hypothetical protein